MGHVGGGRRWAVLNILEGTGRVSGRAGCLQRNTFVFCFFLKKGEK